MIRNLNLKKNVILVVQVWHSLQYDLDLAITITLKQIPTNTSKLSSQVRVTTFQDKSYTNGSYSYIPEKFKKEVSTWAMDGHYLI